ncbi:MAG TPA: tetratricopeptide repeat protein [Terriglobia bacterium]|nr:tetratricopeptide repeat protein [Terriglobia bacterium]
MQALRCDSRKATFVFALAVCALVLETPPRALCQFSGSISGQVTTRDGRSIPIGVTVTVTTSEGQMVTTQPVDSAGHYELDNLRKLDYQLTFAAKGYRTEERDANLRFSGNSLIINVQLTPEGKTETDKGAVVSVAELKVPEQARKEYEKGNRAFKSHNYAKAQRYFEQATNDYPCYARAQTDLATLLIVEKKQAAEAETRLRKAIECDASFLDAYVVLAQLLNARAQYKKSVEVLQQGLAHSPDTWQFHYQMGLARYGMKDYTEAENEFRKVAKLNGNPPPVVYIKLADLYVLQSRFNEAYAEMEAYLQAAPNGNFAPRARAIMKQMKAAGVLSSDKKPEH